MRAEAVMKHLLDEKRQERAELLPLGNNVSVCVDLDGSLIESDSLWEGLWLAVRIQPLEFLKASLTLGSGRAKFKRRIAELAVCSPCQLPYRNDVLSFLSAEVRAGKSLILTTAADELVAGAVARHLGLFSQVVASDGIINRKGGKKLEAINRVTRQFVYVGNSTADLPIWKASAGAVVVGSNRAVLKELRRCGVTIYRHFPTQSSLLRVMSRAIRVHQWPKNFLVLLPIFLGHRTTDATVWKFGLLILVVFCLAASATYVLNDLVDLEADWQHPRKRTRAFASGALSISTGILLFVGLGSASLALSLFFLPLAAQLSIAAYVAATLLYSFHLKTRLMADVVALALLYALRVVAGGTATSIVISPWTIAFCLFFFYSLSLTKRLGELQSLPDNGVPARRGYRKADLTVVAALGASSGLLSVVVFAMYISSPEVKANYCSPTLLWLMCPVILYWFGRIWILANRGDVKEDPLMFALKDKISYIAGLCIVLIWLGASVCR